MWAYTPVADWLAMKCAAKSPNLDIFRKLQQSRFNLAIGLLLAWVIGAFEEEVALRELVLRWIAMLASPADQCDADARRCAADQSARGATGDRDRDRMGRWR
jgi:hypothetical protein